MRHSRTVPDVQRGDAAPLWRAIPYAVIYVDEPDHVLVLAFAHFKRRPGYWIDRLLRSGLAE